MNFNDPYITEHAPNVMPRLVVNLEAQIASDGPLQYQLRRLLNCYKSDC